MCRLSPPVKFNSCNSGDHDDNIRANNWLYSLRTNGNLCRCRSSGRREVSILAAISQKLTSNSISVPLIQYTLVKSKIIFPYPQSFSIPRNVMASIPKLRRHLDNRCNLFSGQTLFDLRLYPKLLGLVWIMLSADETISVV